MCLFRAILSLLHANSYAFIFTLHMFTLCYALLIFQWTICDWFNMIIISFFYENNNVLFSKPRNTIQYH